MKRRILFAALLVFATMILRGDGCLKDKVIEIVVNAETCAEFSQNETNATFANPAIVNFDEDLDDALSEAGYSREDIKKAIVMSAHYGALSNSSAHDWTISGQITVQRGGGGAVTAMNYTQQSVDDALGKKIQAPLEMAAVDLINQALADYIAGQTGITLMFVINNESTSPAPSGGDPMIFTWKAWVAIHVILEETIENVPDPF